MATTIIKAKAFLRDIASAMDDNDLMSKHGLTEEQLHQVFRQLIEMNLLSEQQLEVRTQLSDSQITRAFVDSQAEWEIVP
jgi:hypothetical protein